MPLRSGNGMEDQRRESGKTRGWNRGEETRRPDSGNKEKSPAAFGNDPETGCDSIDFIMELGAMDPIDLGSPRAVKKRFEDYMELCAKYDTMPLIAGFAQAMGTTRAELVGHAKGQSNRLAQRLSQKSQIIFDNCLSALETAWEFNFSASGYKSPVTGIFLAKNNFGYKDTTETVVRHASETDSPDVRALQEKYMAALPKEVPIDVEEGSGRPAKKPSELPGAVSKAKTHARKNRSS